MSDWFSQNGIPTGPPTGGSDWFAQNGLSTPPPANKQPMQDKNSLTGRGNKQPKLSPAGQVADLIEGTGKYGSGAILPALAVAPVATIAGGVGAAAAGYGGRMAADAAGASPDTSRLIGDVAGIAGGVAGGAAGNSAAAAITKARTPNPDLMMGKALTPHPADTEFKNYIPSVRENMQRGAEITQQPITNVDSALDATKAAMKEHMDALEPHKENARRVQAKMPTSLIKFAQIGAIPEGLEVRDPEAYNAAVNEINAQFKGSPYLNTDQVFDQAILNNNQLAAFHSGKADAQSTKLITNSGDTAVLKAAGDAYRQWIAENLGPIAKGINEDWGNLNGTKHYLENKVNPAFLQQPATPLAGAMETTGVHPGMHSIRHGLVQSVAARIAGVPTGIDSMLESAFANTKAADAPWTPNVTPLRLNAPPDASGPIGHNPAVVANSPFAPKQIAAPAPGHPPLNILPRGPGSIGPAGPVPMTSREAPIPMPPSDGLTTAQRMGRAIAQGAQQ